jgi:hypothetical protein
MNTENTEITLAGLPIEYNKVFTQVRTAKNRFEKRYFEREARRMFKQLLKFTDAFLKQNQTLLQLIEEPEAYNKIYSEAFKAYNAAFLSVIPIIEKKIKPVFLRIKPEYFYETFKPEEL